MNDIAVIAPHPDDETLGCGGTLLKRKGAGDRIHWVIATKVGDKYPAAVREERAETIRAVAAAYGFTSVVELGFPTTELDRFPLGDVVAKMKEALAKIKPQTIYLPSRADVHSDHRLVFDAAASCLKWFRAPATQRILSYEAVSETDQGLDPAARFTPNVFIDIEAHLPRKLEILKLFGSELGDFPFPRSIEAVGALARLRGSQAGFKAAEAFELLRERL